MSPNYSNYKLCSDDCLKPEGCNLPCDNPQKGPGRRQVYPKCKKHGKNVFTWANGGNTVTVKPKYNSEGRQSKSKAGSSEKDVPASRKRSFQDLTSDGESEDSDPQTRRRRPETEARSPQYSEPFPSSVEFQIDGAAVESQYLDIYTPTTDFSDLINDDFEDYQSSKDPLMAILDGKTQHFQSPEEVVPEMHTVARTNSEQFEYETTQAFIDNIDMPITDAALALWDPLNENMAAYLPTPDPYCMDPDIPTFFDLVEESKSAAMARTLPQYSVDPRMNGHSIEQNCLSMRPHANQVQIGQDPPQISVDPTSVGLTVEKSCYTVGPYANLPEEDLPKFVNLAMLEIVKTDGILETV